MIKFFLNELCLFLDSSKQILVYILFQSGNKYSSKPIWYSVHAKETLDNVKRLFFLIRCVISLVGYICCRSGKDKFCIGATKMVIINICTSFTYSKAALNKDNTSVTCVMCFLNQVKENKRHNLWWSQNSKNDTRQCFCK